MRNQLLIGYSTDEMFSIDTIEGLDINITKNIYSIEDPSKRLSDFTKTIEIPGSKGNDNIFGSLFDVNFHIRDSQQLNPDFNPARKAVCQYIQDEHIQIDGYCQLTDIKILNENKVIYVIVIYGQNADLFSKIGDKTLNDITGYGATLDTPITSGTFNWNDTEIQASWVTADNGYLYYPMLNRGLGFSSRPSGTYLGGAWGVDYNFFKPWAYARTLFTSILKEAGFKWTSNFLNSPLFKKLIVECDINKFITAQSTMLASQSEALTTSTYSRSMGIDGNSYIYDNYYWTFNSVLANGLSEYNAATGTITVSREGKHDLSIELHTTITSTPAVYPITQIIVIKKVGTSYIPIDSRSYKSSVDANFKFSLTQDFKIGDEIRICVRLSEQNGSISPNTVTITGAKTNKFTFNEVGRYMYGTVNDLAPIFYPVKQTDFIMGIVKMFNLYIEPQPDGSLLIEPRDSFYTNDVTDWTLKLDTSKDFDIKPQGLLNVKEINFNYQQGLTDVSKAFTESEGQIFGYKRAIFTNDFVKDIKKVDLPFICEPLQTQDDQGIVLIRTDYNGSNEERTPKPMIAYAGGLIDCNIYRYYDALANTYTDKTQYAYAGFLDNPNNPQYDLTFGNQEIYFHTIGGQLKLTNNGDLWSQYHRKQWTEIADRDSKLVECYMKLNTYDIATLSFRQAYWIDKAAYRLLEVQDYSPNGDTTTKCIFLKLNEAETLTPSTATTIGNNNGGSTGTGNGGGSGGTYTGGDLGNGMIVQQLTNGLWQGGAGNKIQNSVGVLVSGSNNSVGYGCFNIQIKGSNNTIYPGLSNITLINCDGLEITESDVQYIDNIKVIVGTPINGQVWTYNATSNQIEFATNQFADLNLFFFKTPSDIATYYKMLTSPSTGGSQNVTVPNCSGTTLLATFATEPSSPGNLFIPAGVFTTHFHAKRTHGGNATIYAEVYKRTSGGTETLLATTPVTSTNITLTVDAYELEIYNPSIITLLSSDRLVIKFYTVVASGTPDIGIYIEDAYLSRLEFLAGGSGGGATTFTGLTDTPSSYTGASLKGVRVNTGETALEFYTITSPTGFTFNNVTTTSDTMVANSGYLANNVALVTLTLPLSAGLAVGDILKIKGVGAGGFKIAQNASQKIRWATGSETTVGVTGSLTSTDQNDYIELFYIGTEFWSVGAVKGTFTIT